MTWKQAHPMAFPLKQGRPGRVYRAATNGPPLMVKEISPDELPSDAASVVIEFDDDMKIATNQLMGTTNDTATLIALNPAHARFLCAALIHALADGGDRVAERLRVYMNIAMEEVQNEDQ